MIEVTNEPKSAPIQEPAREPLRRVGPPPPGEQPALLTSPTVLLLDEPTTGLDPRSKLDVQTFIEEVRDTHDATIVLTTHDLTEAERLCDRIALINDGRLVAEDTPAGLKTMVAELHGQEPTLEAVFMTFTGRSLDDDH